MSDENQQVVNLRIVYSIFDASDVQSDELVWFQDKPLSEYLEGLPDHVNWVASVNGHIIEQKDWPTTKLEPNDYLTLKVVPAGGGGKKNIFRMIAQIAVVVIAAVLTWWMGGMGGAMAASAMYVGAAVMAAGSIAIALAFPPPKPKTPSMDNESADTPSYGVDGPKNTSTEEAPVNVVCGEFRVGGNVTNIYMINDGSSQTMYAQYVVSEGEIEDITDILINDQPIANFRDVDYTIRKGTADQPICEWFNDTRVMINNGGKLTYDNWITMTTSKEIDRFAMNYVAPYGLQYIDDDKGKKHGWQVPILIQYRKVGETEWQEMGDMRWENFPGASSEPTSRIRITVNASSPAGVKSSTYAFKFEYRKVGDATWTQYANEAGTIVNKTETKQLIKGDGPVTLQLATTRSFTYLIENLPRGAYEVRLTDATRSSIATRKNYVVGPVFMSGITRNAVRRTVESPLLEQGFYEVRTRRDSADTDNDLFADDVNFEDLVEIINDDVRYRHTAYYAIKVKFTDQLSRIPTVTALVKGILCNIYDIEGNFIERKFSKNPAWLALEILTSPRWGGSMSIARFNMTRFYEWAEFCESKGLYYNGVFDTFTNIWDAVMTVFRVGRAMIVPIGTRYSVVIEREEPVAMMFSVANMVKDSFEIHWLPMEDRANEFEMTYYDKQDGNKRKTIRVVDYEAMARGIPPKVMTIDLPGVDNAEQAYFEGHLQMALNRYVLRMVDFEAPLEAISCNVGSIVYIQHDAPKWADSGRMMAGATTTVLPLDREIAMAPGKTYLALVHHSALQRYSGVVTNKIGSHIFLTIAGPVARVTRCKKGTIDTEILSVAEGSPDTSFLLDDASGISIGDTVELWDTDVLEERYVVPDIGTHQTITLASALTAAPAEFTNWMFGEAVKMKQKYRIKEIHGTHEYKRKIKAFEFNPAIYNDPTEPVPLPQPSLSETSVLPPIEVMVHDYLLKAQDGTLLTKVQVDWRNDPYTWYEGADVWVASESDIYQMKGTVGGHGTSFIFDAIDGEHLKIKVVPYDGTKKLGLNDITPVEYTVLGKTVKPSNVTSFTAVFVDGQAIMTWDVVNDLDISGYEIREGASWDAAASNVLISDFKGNRFSVIKNSGGSFTFWIAALDTSGNYSEVAASATVVVEGPESVRGFDCVSNNNMIVFTWLPNQTEYIPTYEIREGLAWDGSTLVAKVGGTMHAIPVNNDLNRKFWIKAINRFDVESSVAVFASPVIAELPEYNIIGEFDQGTTFTGKKINFDLVTDHLETADGKTHSEYFFDVDLLATFLARNQLLAQYEAVINSTETWADAAYAWSSAQANRQWVVRGDVSSVSLQGYIALKATALESYEVESWSLSNTLTGFGATAASESVSVAYESGGKARFNTHSLIKDSATQVAWTKAVPSEFHVNFWVEPVATGTTYTLFRLVNGSADLRVDYNASTHELSLIGSDGATVSLGTAHGDLAGQRVFVGVSQTDAVRSLYIGIYDTLYSAEANGNHAPIGTWTTVKLY